MCRERVLFCGSGDRLNHLPRRSHHLDRIKGLEFAICLSLFDFVFVTPFVDYAVSLVSVTLADDDRNVRRATVPYAPLYPTFQESLDRFRRGEHSELIQKGAERVFHNVGVYDTRRSSEDGSVNLVAVHPADIPSAGPQEQSLDNEVRPNPPVGYGGLSNQSESNINNHEYQWKNTFRLFVH